MEQSYAEAERKKENDGSVIAFKNYIDYFGYSCFFIINTDFSIDKINLLVLIGVAAIFGIDLVLAEIPCGMGICIL